MSFFCNLDPVHELDYNYWDHISVFDAMARGRLFTVPLFFRGILETGMLRWNRRHLGL